MQGLSRRLIRRRVRALAGRGAAIRLVRRHLLGIHAVKGTVQRLAAWLPGGRRARAAARPSSTASTAPETATAPKTATRIQPLRSELMTGKRKQ